MKEFIDMDPSITDNQPQTLEPVFQRLAIGFVFGVAVLVIIASIWVWVLWLQLPPLLNPTVLPVSSPPSITEPYTQDKLDKYKTATDQYKLSIDKYKEALSAAKDFNSSTQTRLTFVYDSVIKGGLIGLFTATIAGLFSFLISRPLTYAARTYYLSVVANKSENLLRNNKDPPTEVG